MKFEETGADNGTARINPTEPVEVATSHTWTITYTAGPAGIAVGGGIRVAVPVHFTEPQFTDPTAQGHTVAAADRSGSRTEIRLRDTHTLEIPDPAGRLEYPSRGFARPDQPDLWVIPHPWAWRFYIKIWDAPLAEGDSITIVYGTAGATPGTVAPRTAYFRIATDTDGKREGPYSGYRLIADTPSMSVLPGPPCRYAVTVPSVLKLGEEAVVHVQGMDQFDNPAASPGEAAQNVQEVTAPEVGLKFTPFDGTRPDICAYESTVTAVETGRTAGPFPDDGFRHIKVRNTTGAVNGTSNPFTVRREPPTRRLFWGDIHGHTFCSDGLGTLDEYYAYAREISRLDIAATADHSQYMSDEEWAQIQDAARRYNDPGSFVTFSGYEYSHNAPTAPYFGDKNIYFLDDDSPIYRANNKWRGYWSDFLEVCKRLPEGKTLIIPHAHAGGMDAGYDPRFMPVVEMRSMHGSFETPQEAAHIPWEKRSGRSLQELLHKGIRVGVIASGDGHEGHPGHAAHGSRRSNFGALMGVWCSNLTRESVWDALWKRSCYATTGARIYLELTINDEFMGSEMMLAGPKAERRIRVVAGGDNQIAHVDVVKDNTVFHSENVYGDHSIVEIVDTDYCRGQDFYYARVTQIDGQQAWSSPIWVTVGPEFMDHFPEQVVRA